MEFVVVESLVVEPLLCVMSLNLCYGIFVGESFVVEGVLWNSCCVLEVILMWNLSCGIFCCGIFCC